MRSRKTKVAIAQARAEYLDLKKSTDKAVALIRQAASKGAKLVAMGETWLPGYPAWLDRCPDAAFWNHAPVKEVFARLRENSISVHSPELKRIAEAARKGKISVVIGANERVNRGPGNGTLFNSIFIFDQDGRLAMHHRKLVPTYTERMVWGPGDGRGLEAADTSTGRVGALICWEHWMPMARQAMHDSGEDIHVALWPTAHDAHQLASRHYAFEGRCFVLAVGCIMPAADLPKELARPQRMRSSDLLLRGGSAVIAPDGGYVIEPFFGKEKLIVAEIDLARCDQERMTLDVSGHYARPDIFEFNVKPLAKAAKG